MTLMFIRASPGGTGGGIKDTPSPPLVGRHALHAAWPVWTRVVIRGWAIFRQGGLRPWESPWPRCFFVAVDGPWLLGLGPGPPAPIGHTHSPSSTKLFTCILGLSPPSALMLGGAERLESLGQLVLMVGMFVGRIGILLLLSAIFGKTRPVHAFSPTRHETLLKSELPSHYPLSPSPPVFSPLRQHPRFPDPAPSRRAGTLHLRPMAPMLSWRWLGCHGEPVRPWRIVMPISSRDPPRRRRRAAYRQRILAALAASAIPCAGRFYTLDDGLSHRQHRSSRTERGAFWPTAAIQRRQALLSRQMPTTNSAAWSDVTPERGSPPGYARHHWSGSHALLIHGRKVRRTWTVDISLIAEDLCFSRRHLT